ncbi:MAG: hypothetical protein ACRD0P_06535 [Stackebrandtia sp.]
MSQSSETIIEQATQFIWTTGSVLDQRRMALFAGTGDRDAVLNTVAAYRAPAGGFAFALEPDVKGPEPQPLTAMVALEILDEADAIDQSTAAPICDWLAGVSATDGGVPNLLPSIEPYPRPPWVAAPTEVVGELLATARITGLLLKHRVEHPWIETARAFCRAAIEALATTHPYEVFSLNVLLDNDPDRDWARGVSKRLGELVREADLVLLDPANPRGIPTPPGYAEQEFHFAVDFAPTPDGLAAAWFSSAELAASLEHLRAERLDDGGWPIHYRRWTPGIEYQARPGFTLRALHTLRAWNQLD